MNKKELEIIVDEWSDIANGTKTVPLIQLGSGATDIKQERKIFDYCSRMLRKLLSKEDDQSNH